MKRTVCMILLGVLYAGCCLAARTQVGAAYAGELQSDFRDWNWVNMLRLEFSQPLVSRFRLDIATISIARTREGRLIDDLQGFSNIEEEDTPLAPAVACVTWSRGRSQLSVGIRNVNEDYFTSPVTSFFTNSSCGLFPTVSANYPIANYPLASLGIHYVFQTERWEFQASVYNGQGYDSFTGRSSVFRFRPAADGLCGIASTAYRNHGSSYHLGGVLYGSAPCREGQTKTREVSGAIWGYAEQRVTQDLYLLVQCSVSLPENTAWCRMYAGAGVHMQIGKVQIGAFTNRALFRGIAEQTAELTCRAALSPHVSLQPALHLIGNGTALRSIALLRLGIEL